MHPTTGRLRDQRVYRVVQSWELFVDIADASCECGTIRFRRNLVQCINCGTVYGVARVSSYKGGWTRIVWDVDFEDGQVMPEED